MKSFIVILAVVFLTNTGTAQDKQLAQAPDIAGPKVKFGGSIAKEELDHLNVHHQAYEQAKEQLKAINVRLRTNLTPLEKAKTEEEYYRTLQQRVVPALAIWRDDIRARKGQYQQAEADLLKALNQTMTSFDTLATKYEKVAASDQLRTLAGKKQTAQLGQGLKKTAAEFREYSKKLQVEGKGTAMLLDYAEDAGFILDGLDAFARGQLDVAAKKVGAEGKSAELREFLEAVRETLDRALEPSEPKLPEVPGLKGAPAVKPPLPAKLSSMAPAPKVAIPVHSPDQRYDLAVAAVSAGRLDEAERHFSEIVRLATGNLQQRARQGLAYVRVFRS